LPGKHLTPKSALAALANADRPDRPANPAGTAATDNRAKTATKEDPERMPAKKKNYCPSRPNANAWPNPDRPVQLVPKAPTVHQAMRVVQAATVNPDHKARPVHLALLALLVKTALQDRKEKTAN